MTIALRILHLITGLGVGGAEDQLVHVLRRSRHDVEVAHLEEHGPAAAELLAAGIPVFDLAAPGRYDVRAATRLAALIHRRRYDAVHVHLLRAGLQGRVVARALRVPLIVYTEHSLGRTEVEGLAATTTLRRLYRLSERTGDVTVAVSPWVADRLEEWGVPRTRIVTIANGVDFAALRFDPAARVDVRTELGIPPGAEVIGSVGRMVPRKNQRLLLDGAAARVRAGAWLVLVGDGPERAALEEQAEQLGIAARTVFAGTRRDVPALLSAFDVFASLPLEEMYGLAPVEALAAGLPVLVVHCPPLSDVAEPRVWHTEPSAEAVAAALDGALAQPPDRDEVRGRHGARLDIEATVDALDALYEQRVGRRLSRR